jgi:formate dehydrogenase iron-sulfur subunit
MPARTGEWRRYTPRAWRMRIFMAPPGTPGATGGLQQLNAFFLLTAAPETYNLPRAPSLASGLATVAGLALASLLFLAARRGDRQ